MIARILRLVLVLQIAGGLALGALIADLLGARAHLGAALVLGLLAAFAVHPLIIALDFAITGAVRSQVPPALRLGPVAALVTYAVEVRAGMRSFSFANPFLCERAAPRPRLPAQALPILFLHGYFCNRGMWMPFMAEAARRGFHCEALTLEPAFGVLESYILPIEAAIARLCAASGAPQVIVVAHSMGGLAARAWMRATGGGRLARLITLGSPHAGTIMAGFGHGGSVRQMRLASPWLERLGGDESTEKRAQITSVFSHHDNIIATQLSASLAGATNIALAGLGHVALVYEHAVWDLVLDIAQTTARAVPAPAAHA